MHFTFVTVKPFPPVVLYWVKELWPLAFFVWKRASNFTIVYTFPRLPIFFFRSLNSVTIYYCPLADNCSCTSDPVIVSLSSSCGQKKHFNWLLFFTVDDRVGYRGVGGKLSWVQRPGEKGYLRVIKLKWHFPDGKLNALNVDNHG